MHTWRSSAVIGKSEKSSSVVEKWWALRKQLLASTDSGGINAIFCQMATEGTCTELLSKYTKLKMVKSKVLG